MILVSAAVILACGLGTENGAVTSTAATVRGVAHGSPACGFTYIRDFNEQAARTPVEEQAMPILLEFARRLKLPKDSDECRRLFKLVPNDPEWNKACLIVDQHAEVLTYLKQIRGKTTRGMYLSDSDPLTRPADESNMMLLEIVAHYLTTVKDAARLLAVDARMRWEKDDAAGAMDSIHLMLDLAQAIDHESLLLSQVVCLAVHARACEVLGQMLASKPELLSADSQQQLAGMIERAWLGTNVETAMEQQIFADVIARVYCQAGNPLEHATDEGLMRLARTLAVVGKPVQAPEGQDRIEPSEQVQIAKIRSYFKDLGTRTEISHKTDELFIGARTMLACPLWDQRVSEYLKIEEEICSQTDQRYKLLGLLLPAYKKAYVSQEQCLQMLSASLVTLEIVGYRREHGHWPAHLDDLNQPMLLDRCVDRYTGKRLSYRVIEGKPALYSAGPDRDDDQGKPCQAAPLPRGDFFDKPIQELPDGDWILWQG